MNRDGSVLASAATPSDSNIYYRLEEFKEQNPDATLNDFLSKIQINRWTVSNRQELEQLAHEFESIEQKGPLEDPEMICLDGTGYTFSIHAATTEKTIDIGCSSETPPLVRWAEKARRILNGSDKKNPNFTSMLSIGENE
jgi:hypothetical protein